MKVDTAIISHLVSADKVDTDRPEALTDAALDSRAKSYKRWFVLAACMTISGPLIILFHTVLCTSGGNLGWPMVYGVFQEYYENTMFPDKSASLISLINGLACLIGGLGSFGGGILGDKMYVTSLNEAFGGEIDVPSHSGQKKTLGIGLLLCFVSNLTTAFCHTFWQTMLARGILFGVGQSMILPILFLYPSQYFPTAAGLTNGLVGGSSGIAGGGLALLARHLLSAISYRNTMLYLAAILGASWAVCWVLLKDFYSPEEIRLATKRPSEETNKSLEAGTIDSPTSDKSSDRLKSPNSVSSKAHYLAVLNAAPQDTAPRLSEVTMYIAADRWRYNIIPRFRLGTDKFTFWSLLVGISISTLGFMSPYSYITSYTKQYAPEVGDGLKLSAPISAMLFGMGLGRIGFGLIADQLGPVESLICCISVSGVLQLAMWRHVFSFQGITAFSALYGFFSGANFSLPAAVVARIFGPFHPRLGSVLGVIGVSLSFGEGFGPAIAGITRSKESDRNSWIFIQGISGATQLVGAACIALVMRGEICRCVLRLVAFVRRRRV